MFSQTSFQICRIFGVPVKIDISLLLMAGMFIFGYSSPGGSLADAFIAGLASSLALVSAIFVHELGHAVVALAHGCRVHEITLMFFGGYASISGLPRAPLRQAAISLAGPAAGILLWLAIPAPQGNGVSLAGFFFAEAARMSLFLSIFNLIPAIPLDGGNIFRAVLAHFKGRQYATVIACRTAKWIAVAMGLYGLFNGSLIFLFLAFFIWSASRRELMRSAFDGDSPDDLDDDVVVISPPPYGKNKEYTRIKRR